MSKPRFLIGYSCCNLTLEAFERAGCEAWTCDLLPSRGRPDRHIKGDIWDVATSEHWDGGLFHPMCTYLTVAAAWAAKDPDFERYPEVGYHQRVKEGTLTGAARREAYEQAVQNFKRLDALHYPHAIENPAPSLVSKAHRKPDQILQPYQHGDDASKGTGLWIRGLPLLPKVTNYVEPRLVCCGQVIDKGSGNYGCPYCGGRKSAKPRWGNQTDSGQNRVSPSDDRWLERSKTYPGIANLMGEKWGGYLVLLHQNQ